jgi:hypothetical protein
MKAPRCLAILLLLAGCTANPFVNRTIETESGESARHRFAYGQFCGSDRPSSMGPDTPIDLFDFWPPVDDIDATCFAHDYCLQATNFAFNECDFAMALTNRHFRQLFSQQACYNLSSDIMTVMENLAIGQWPTRKAQKIFSVANAAVTDSVAKVLTKKTNEYPDEGDCRMVTQSSATMVLDAFEYFFHVATSPIGTDPAAGPKKLEIPRDRLQRKLKSAGRY